MKKAEGAKKRVKKAGKSVEVSFSILCMHEEMSESSRDGVVEGGRMGAAVKKVIPRLPSISAWYA